jgi:hypothetical protein
MYVINTDQGYIKGDMHNGLYFTIKEEARQFTYEDIILYGDSIATDLFEFYCCENVGVEVV